MRNVHFVQHLKHFARVYPKPTKRSSEAQHVSTGAVYWTAINGRFDRCCAINSTSADSNAIARIDRQATLLAAHVHCGLTWRRSAALTVVCVCPQRNAIAVCLDLDALGALTVQQNRSLQLNMTCTKKGFAALRCVVIARCNSAYATHATVAMYAVWSEYEHTHERAHALARPASAATSGTRRSPKRGNSTASTYVWFGPF